MAWRVVNSLTTLRMQLNAAFPYRSTASDGTIGDVLHTSTSDHSPHLYATLGSTPVVTAFDGTQDPAHGCDCSVVTEQIRLSRDSRVKYVIWNHRMYSSYKSGSGIPAWTWRPYTGSGDPHTNHFHISVLPIASADDTRPWAIGAEEDMTPDQAAQLAQLHAMVRADRWQWQTDRAGFIAAGGVASIWDYGGGMGVNEEAALLEQLAADVAELKARPPVEVSATELAAALVADPAFAALLNQAALEGAQRAEDE